MNYTLIKDKTPKKDLTQRVNKKIQNDIDYICSKVNDLLGNQLYCILLCGGFGRGEGSVTVKNNLVHIVNDYDFTVVLNAKNKLHYLWLYKKIQGPLEKLAQSLAQELDIKQVDLSPKPLSYFKQTTLKIENYEVKKGHLLVFGKKNPTQSMPSWKPDKIPLFEGTWLFRNRGAGLLLAALYFMDTQKVKRSDNENFIIECTKAQLAMGDAVLLLKKRYHHLYNKRLITTRTLDLADIPFGEEIKNRYQKSLVQKLNPDFEKYMKIDLVDWWYDAANLFLKFFMHYEQKRLGQSFDSWIDYTSLTKPEDRLDIKMLAGRLAKSTGSISSLKSIQSSIKKSNPSYGISLVALVLFSAVSHKFDIPAMNKAAQLFNMKLTGHPKSDWILLARVVLNEIHPGGEAGRVIAEHK